MSRNELNKDTFDKFQGDSIVTDASFRGVGESFQGCIDLAERIFGNKANIILLPGTYDGDITVTTCKIHASVPNTIRFNGTITGGVIDNEGNGFAISGNTLTVTPDAIGAGKRWANYQAVVTDIEAGTAGVPTPTAENNVWLFFDKNAIEETITVTNPYLSIEVVCGDRTITIIEDFA